MPLLLGPCLALVLGAGLGVVLPATLSSLWLLPSVLLAWAAVVHRWWIGDPRLTLMAGVLAALCGLTAGHAAERATTLPPLRAHLGVAPVGAPPDAAPADADPTGDVPVDLEGWLREDARPGPTGVTLDLVVMHVEHHGRRVEVGGGVRLTVAGAEAERRLTQWIRGRRVRVAARLRRPGMFLTPGVPDGERALARRGVTLVGSVKSGLLVDVVGPGTVWQETGAQLRHHARQALRRVASPTGASVGMAILLGERATLAPEVERQLLEAGTYHVLAISGGNLALCAAAVLVVASALGRRGPVTTAVALAVTLAYADLTSGGTSVARAAVAAGLVLGARVLDQRIASLQVLALAAAALVLWDPLVTTDPGFWLTSGATAGLLAVGAMSWVRVSRGVRWVVAGLAATLSVEVVLLPIATGVFERVTLAGVLLNLVAVPAMTVVQGAAMAAVACDAVSFTLATLAGRVLDMAVFVLVGSSGLTAVAPWLSWRVPPSHPAIGGMYWAVLIATLVAWHGPSVPRWLQHRRQRLALAAAVLGVWLASHPPSLWPARPDGHLHVTLLDVGQGDAALVELPDGVRMLVDAGGVSGPRFDVGDRVIGPALRARGIRGLDVLVLTHGDADHVSGARQVLRDFHPREVWEGVPVGSDTGMRAVEQAARARGIVWRQVAAGLVTRHGPATVRVLHPRPPDWTRDRVRNDDSVVVQLELGRTRVLLCGDLERAGEAELIERERAPEGQVVLKVGHHGSRTSSSPAFLAWAQPDVALFSVGRRNRFGHPDAGVLQRLGDTGAALWRTDRDGTITVRSDGQSVSVSAVGRRQERR